MLLSNVSLLELLQKVLECTWTRSFPSEPAYLLPEDALLCSGWLLAASLLIYQHRYNAEVRSILVFRSRDWLNLKKKKKQHKYLISRESGLLWPGICLSWLLCCYTLFLSAPLQQDWKLACCWRMRHKSFQSYRWAEILRGKMHTQVSWSKSLYSSRQHKINFTAFLQGNLGV